MNASVEVERQSAVDRYAILDTPPDGAFDNITAISAAIFNVPIAIVSIVDHDRIWFKSHHGVDINQVSRDPGLCASAILRHTPTIINDARLDPQALANPLVAGEAGMRFYAAAPLRTSDGFNLGTLCVLDKKPREVTENQMHMLQSLAAVVVDELELRLSTRKVVQMGEEIQAQTLRQKIDAEQRFRQAFDHAPIGMALTSPDLSVLEVNAAFCEMLEYREMTVLLENITTFLHPDDKGSFLTALNSFSVNKARKLNAEMRWITANGLTVLSRITLATVVDTEQQPVRFILQVEDITKHAPMQSKPN